MNFPLTKLKPSTPDTRDIIASISVLSVLPPSVDMKPDVIEVENQGLFSSCTANAGCSAMELMYNQSGLRHSFSRMYLYYYTRQLGGILGDEGANARDIGKALNKYGVCLESAWPYIPANLTLSPSAPVIAEAAQFKIKSYEKLTGDLLTQIKNSVAQGVPVLLTIFIYQDFWTVSGPWQTHIWNNTESATNPIIGAHEVLVIGYDDVSHRLLVENSWGPAWADGGFFGIPYAMVVDPLTVDEAWVIYPNLPGLLVPVPPVPVDTTISGTTLPVVAAVIAVIVLMMILFQNYLV
jgi:C1A family cysteine protease